MARYCPCGNQVLPNRGICQECGEIYDTIARSGRLGCYLLLMTRHAKKCSIHGKTMNACLWTKSNLTDAAAIGRSVSLPCAAAGLKRTYIKIDTSTEANEWNLT